MKFKHHYFSPQKSPFLRVVVSKSTGTWVGLLARPNMLNQAKLWGLLHGNMSSTFLSLFSWSSSFLSQVGSNAGIVGMTKEHLGLALALNVPVFVVVTKIDMCPANILQGTETLYSNAHLTEMKLCNCRAYERIASYVAIFNIIVPTALM